MHSLNQSEINISRLKELFPECLTEVKNLNGHVNKVIDFDKLRQELSEVLVEGVQERYQITWPGKRNSIIAANSPISKTLRPFRELSVDFDSTKNIFIEGDNLDALKLLQETYLGKVKMIYIDPPYNTGNDFIYKDNFSEGVDDYLEKSNQVDENSNRMVSNTESNGRFHSDWLSMIYPRIKLAKNLLRNDGLLFISIDDSEFANLKRICDEIFGEDAFIASFVWKTRQASGKQIAQNYVSTEHEYILCFGKTAEAHLNGIARDKSTYSNPDNDPRGIWAKHPLDVGSTKEERPNCFYNLVDPKTGISYPANPNRVWAFAPSSMAKLIEEEKIIFHPEGKTRPGLKKFFNELKSEKKPISSWLDRENFDIGFNSEGTKDLNELFDNIKLFDYPKPTSVLKLLIEQSTGEDDIVLDFFAGSGSTGQAIWESFVDTEISRRFILVQLPEKIPDDSLAKKEGYDLISEITSERLRRSGKKVQQELKDKILNKKIDSGFRFFKIDSSNMSEIYYSPDNLSQDLLSDQTDNVKSNRTPEDLLFQVLLDWGVDLALSIQKETIHGKDVYLVDQNALAACFDSNGGVDEEFVKELAKKQPLRVVFRDAGFKSDSVKINVEQIFKLVSPSTEVKCI